MSTNAKHLTAKKPCKRCDSLLRYESGGCVVCVRQKANEWRIANPDRVRELERASRKRNPERFRESGRRWRRKNPEQILLSQARRRSRESGLNFNLEVSDIVIPDHCPVLGIQIERPANGRHGPKNSSPSIDRIVPSLGYVKGNIRVISWRANNLRRDATAEELMLIALDAKALEVAA